MLQQHFTLKYPPIFLFSSVSCLPHGRGKGSGFLFFPPCSLHTPVSFLSYFPSPHMFKFLSSSLCKFKFTPVQVPASKFDYCRSSENKMLSDCSWWRYRAMLWRPNVLIHWVIPAMHWVLDKCFLFPCLFHRYVEQSNLMMEKRNNSLQTATENTQARVLHAEQEKVK